MGQSLTATIRTTLTGNRANTGDKESALVALSDTISCILTSGVGNAQADLSYSDTLVLTASETVELDLAGGLTDPSFGGVLTFAKVRAIIIVSKLAANKQLTIGGAASNALATVFGNVNDVLKLDALGCLVLTNPNAGYAVTGGTADLLKIANASGGSSTVDIWILGTSS